MFSWLMRARSEHARSLLGGHRVSQQGIIPVCVDAGDQGVLDSEDWA
jgi:hypothetical protein